MTSMSLWTVCLIWKGKMHKQIDPGFLKELKLRSDFWLIYEFVLWDYFENKIELDTIKNEIENRNGKKSLLKFTLAAFLTNFSFLFFESVYNDRWDFFETSKMKACFQVIVGLIIQSIILIALGFIAYSMKEIVWKFAFGFVMLIFILPSAVKTIRDCKNFLN